MKRYLIVGPLILVAVWFLLTYFGVVQPIFLPPLSRVFRTFFVLFFTGEIFPDFLKTLYRWLIGLLVGVVCGIPTGILMGYSDKAYASFEIVIDFFRSLPSIVLFPLFMVFFGLGDAPKISIAILASFLYITVSTIYGVKYARQSRFVLGKVYRATQWQILSKIIFPGALPDIFAGIRVSVSITLIVVIAAEMITGGRAGLGKILYEAALIYDMAKMYAVIIIIGLLGYISNKGFVTLENEIIHWRGQ